MVEPRIQFILSPFQNSFFHEVAEALVHELRAGGCKAELSNPADVVLDDAGVFVLLPPHEYVALEGDGWLHDPVLLGRTISIMAEQPHQHHFVENAQIAKKAAAAFDFNRQAVAEYRRNGVDAQHLHFGYTSLWDRFTAQPAYDRDVIYLGSDEERRQILLGRCAPVLSQWTSRLIVSDNASPNRATSASFISGEAKRQLIVGSRVLLNIHRSYEPYFEWLRFIEAFHCGATVVSETCLHPDPFRGDVDYISSSANSLPHVLAKVLEDDQRIAETRRDAYDRLRSYPLSRSLDALVGVAQQLTSRPVPTEIPLRSRTQPYPHPHDYGVRLDEHSDGSVVRQSMREVRLELQGLRRQLAALQHQLADSSWATKPLQDVAAESPAWATSTAPDVSVLIAMYNHRDFVVDALDSLLSASFEHRLEVIVVNDGSTDGSDAVVAAWIDSHPQLAARLISFKANQGLPAARNACVEQARGEFAFVLDSDNAVLPGGIDQLIHALRTTPEASFAFGCLEAFDQDGPVASLGMMPWQPRRLRNGNYIDAMAAVRLTDLRALGGYTTDRRVYGWEDYDLWCRMAESGRHGIHVPNFVARYRRLASSMVSLSNVSQVPAFVALAERCPQLWSGRLDGAEVGSYDRVGCRHR